MESNKNLLTSVGISFAVSTFVVMVNNYFLYRHSCKKEQKQTVKQTEQNTTQ